MQQSHPSQAGTRSVLSRITVDECKKYAPTITLISRICNNRYIHKLRCRQAAFFIFSRHRASTSQKLGLLDLMISIELLTAVMVKC